MPLDLESVVNQLTDSGIVSPKKLEPFIPPNAYPTTVEELVRELLKKQQLTRFQATQIAAGKAKSLILGNYILTDKIGSGGMGQVFKALHRRMKRVVALKTLPPETMKDEETVARFQREVEAAAKLRHPNIVAADDADEANGIHFLVMEYVDGKDLSARVKEKGTLSIEEAIDIILQAARGLEFAHKKKVVHRDIKPSNLLLDREGVVKILDMGLARIESDGTFVTRTELTQTGTMMGTVDYVAPEQAVDSKTADSRADIYSLGCTMFYLLTARATYSGQSIMAKLLAHRDAPIPWLTEHRDDIPDDLDEVFQKMIAKQPEDRYQTMSDIIEDLEKVQQRLNKGIKPKSKIKKPSSQTITLVTGESNVTKSGVTVDLASQSGLRQSGLRNKTDLARFKWPLVATGGLIGLVLVVAAVMNLMPGGQKPAQPGAAVASIEKPSEASASESRTPAGLGDTKTDSPTLVEKAFKSLTNGRDLTGWTVLGNEDCWKSVDGAIVASSRPGKLNYLLTARDYGDFILRFDYVLEQGSNSGIGILAHPQDTGVVEIQLGNDPLWPTGGLWWGTKGSVDDFIQPTITNKERPPGELNSFEVSLRSRRLTVTVNGVEISRYELADLADKPDSIQSLKQTSGRIGLQAQVKEVKFYNLRIAELSPPKSAATPSTELKSYEWPKDTPKPAVAPFDSLKASQYQQAWAEYLKVPVNFTNKIGMKFRLIPPGEFLMGSTPDEIEPSLKAMKESGDNQLWQDCVRNEGPQHKVVITRPFYMATCEVTQDEFELIMGRNPSFFSKSGPGKDNVKDMHSGRLPVEKVSWDEAVEFCKRLNKKELIDSSLKQNDNTGYRLPTEAEWEFATRAGTVTRFWRGNDDTVLKDSEWYRENSGQRTHAVGELKSNPFGLYDTLGNVFEWVQDPWAPGYYQLMSDKLAIDPTGPSGALSTRMFRGGDWYTVPALCRSASHRATESSPAEHIIGFRVALPCAAAP